MTSVIPTEEELRTRIVAHLKARPGNPFVAVIWQGYLAGLVEWGMLDPEIDRRLNDLLPRTGRVEAVEILAGPEYVDQHPEVLAEVLATAAE